MQSFDAKPISPFPSGCSETQKTGGGDGVGRGWGGSSGEEIVTPHSLLLRSRATRPPHPPGRLSECWRGCKGRAARAPRAPREQPLVETARTHALLVFLRAAATAQPTPTPRSEIRVLLGLSHTVLPVMRREERRRGRGSGSFLCSLRRPGRAQARTGATGSARAGERTLAPSPAPVPALPAAWPFPFLWVPVKPSRPETSAEHHGICADASR